MAHILKRKINNVIYVYQEKSYRDKLGRPRTKQKCLGKLDSKGVLILSRKINPENLPGTITQYIIITKKFRIKAIRDSHDKISQLHENRPNNITQCKEGSPLTLTQRRRNRIKAIRDSHKQSKPQFLRKKSVYYHAFIREQARKLLYKPAKPGAKFSTQAIIPEISQINLCKYKL